MHTTTLLSVGRRAGTTALSVARADAQAWGAAIESAARTIAALATACFVAGLTVGRFVHQLNDQLAAAYRCLLAGGHRAAAVVTETIEPAAAAAVELIEEATGLPLSSHSVAELRTIARQRLGSAARLEGRRIAQASRRQLLAALA